MSVLRSENNSKVPTIHTGTPGEIQENVEPGPPSSSLSEPDIILTSDIPAVSIKDGPATRTRSSRDPIATAAKAKERADLYITAQMCLSQGPHRRPNGDPFPPGRIPLTVKDMNDNTVEYFIRPLSPLSHIFHNFVNQIKLRRNEVRLTDIDTPASRRMISGDSIDCFRSVSGGITINCVEQP